MSYEEATKTIDEASLSIAEGNNPKGIGKLQISKRSREKLRNEISTVLKSNKQAYMDMIPHLERAVTNSVLLEEHRKRLKSADGKPYIENGSDPNRDKE